MAVFSASSTFVYFRGIAAYPMNSLFTCHAPYRQALAAIRYELRFLKKLDYSNNKNKA